MHPYKDSSKKPIQNAHDHLERAKRHSPVVGLLVLIGSGSIASGRARLFTPVLPCACVGPILQQASCLQDPILVRVCQVPAKVAKLVDLHQRAYIHDQRQVSLQVAIL